MDRVVFLVEETGERIDCMLNPETLVVRRTAGVRPERAVTGRLRAGGLDDDPLLHTGGGRTTIELQLLFDVALAGGPTDVRVRTRPLWELAEDPGAAAGDPERAPEVLLVWGKDLRVRGLVTAVAERLDDFTTDGVPRRSWLALRLVRTARRQRPPAPALVPGGPPPSPSPQRAGTAIPAPVGDGAVGRPDLAAQALLGAPWAWRAVYEANDLDDPLAVPPGTALRAPGGAP